MVNIFSTDDIFIFSPQLTKILSIPKLSGFITCKISFFSPLKLELLIIFFKLFILNFELLNEAGKKGFFLQHGIIITSKSFNSTLLISFFDILILTTFPLFNY